MHFDPADSADAEPFDPPAASVARTRDGRLDLPSADAIAALPPDGGDAYNRLIFSDSPYLLQHARNPVDWREWSDEAFAEARQRDVPVFLSVGYSTCHWCHVMEHESFEDDDVARLLNEGFVCIKVDREERPDVDQLYMAVVQAMTGSGGWPMTLVLTPDREPIFGATYLPRASTLGRVGMLDLLPQLTASWRTKGWQLKMGAREFFERLGKGAARDARGRIDAGLVGKGVQQLVAMYDHEHGGFGEPPKFPVPHNLRLLLWWGTQEDDALILEQVRHTLRAMRCGGLWDHVGGGFHRYSTDEQWLLPHFEKMLYDQALMALAYTEAALVFDDPLFESTAREVCDYVLRDLTGPEGGFLCAEDADSEGEEGRFYLWTPSELVDALGERDAARVAVWFGVEEGGNYRDEATGRRTGGSVLHLVAELDDEARRDWPALRAKLFAAREERVRPLRDDKVVCDWNGLMIAALARAGSAFADPRLIEAAERAAAFVRANLVAPGSGRLLRRWRDGRAAHDGLLDDHAFLAWGLLELFRATGRVEHLAEARRLVDAAVDLFWFEDSGGFTTAAADATDLAVRMREVHDGALPSGNSVMAMNLFTLARATGEVAYERRGEDTLSALVGRVRPFPAGHSHYLMALHLATCDAVDLVVSAADDDAEADRRLEQIRRTYLPHVTLVERRASAAAALARVAPFTADMASGELVYHLCRGFACATPTTDFEAVRRALVGE